jgi:hypothetical protein
MLLVVVRLLVMNFAVSVTPMMPVLGIGPTAHQPVSKHEGEDDQYSDPNTEVPEDVSGVLHRPKIGV